MVMHESTHCGCARIRRLALCLRLRQPRREALSSMHTSSSHQATTRACAGARRAYAMHDAWIIAHPPPVSPLFFSETTAPRARYPISPPPKLQQRSPQRRLHLKKELLESRLRRQWLLHVLTKGGRRVRVTTRPLPVRARRPVRVRVLVLHPCPHPRRYPSSRRDSASRLDPRFRASRLSF